MENLNNSTPRRQGFKPQSKQLEFLIADLRGLRDGTIGTDQRQRSAVLIGQLALLASEYQRGRRPSRKALKRFFRFVAQEQGL